MKLPSLALAVVFASHVASASPAADPAAPALARLAVAAKCDNPKSLWRSWCIATRWSTGTAAALPTGKVLVGLTIELEDGRDVGDALGNAVSLSAFAVDAAGVKLTVIKPTTADEEQSTAKAVFELAGVTKGIQKTATLPPDLASYAKTLKGAYRVTRSATEWTWSGASTGRARKVGDFWVVIEQPAASSAGPKGYWVTILTDAWK